MHNQYYMSWELGRERRPRVQPNWRALIRLGLFLLALLLLCLVILLIFVGNEARASGGGGTLSEAAKPVHAGYAFMLPDFIPGADAPGLPDLSRGIWDFAWGCSVVVRLLVLGALPVAILVAYRRGLRKGREQDG